MLPTPDPDLVVARREAAVSLTFYVAAGVWTLGCAAWLGYGRPATNIRLIAGVPDWFLVSVLLPWGTMAVATSAYAWFGMRDCDLGGDEEPEAPNGPA